MRVVGGRLGGRRLVGPTSQAIRPTSDRLRESLFNILEHGYGGVEGLRVIDLFAGTGALGIEALSRGAQFALFVDDGAEARALIRENCLELGLGGLSRIFRRNACKLGDAPPRERFQLAFLDPPYGIGLAEPALQALVQGHWLDAQALVIVEEVETQQLAVPETCKLIERRAFGDSQLCFLRF